MAYNKKKVKKTLRTGIVFVNATFNNTIIAITDANGEVAAWESAGSIGYKGSRKSPPSSPTAKRRRGAETDPSNKNRSRSP